MIIAVDFTIINWAIILKKGVTLIYFEGIKMFQDIFFTEWSWNHSINSKRIVKLYKQSSYASAESGLKEEFSFARWKMLSYNEFKNNRNSDQTDTHTSSTPFLQPLDWWSAIVFTYQFLFLLVIFILLFLLNTCNGNENSSSMLL